MENHVVAVPVLCLPSPAQQRVSTNMGCMEQLAFSILSKKATSVVKSLKQKCLSVRLAIRKAIAIEVSIHGFCDLLLYFRYPEPRNEAYQSVGNTPESLMVVYTPGGIPELGVNQMAEGEGPYPMFTYMWNTSLTLRGWLLHILNIYDESRIEALQFYFESGFFDLRSIRTALRGIEVPTLHFRQPYDEWLFREAIKVFPRAKRLERIDQIVDSDQFLRVLLSNFDFFTAIDLPYFGSLDRLLSINASTILIEHASMTARIINKLLKLWMRGAMPRLRHLLMVYAPERNVKKDVIVNEIDFTERGEDQERSDIFEWFDGPTSLPLKGGLSIVRNDGLEASIQLMEYENGSVNQFEFYVWSY